jgi:hypothetical protein
MEFSLVLVYIFKFALSFCLEASWRAISLKLDSVWIVGTFIRVSSKALIYIYIYIVADQI